MSIPSLVIVAGVLSIMGFFVYQMFTAEKRRKQQKNELRTFHGFHLVDSAEAAFIQRLISIHQKHPRQQLQIKDLAVRNESDFRLYTYDVLDTGGNDSHLHEEWALTIVSPHLNIPRFTLIPKIDMSGKLAKLANHFLEKFTPKDAHVIKFDHHEQFSRRYQVTGNEEDAIREIFTTGVLNQLSNTTFWFIDGEDDLLTFSKFQFNAGARKNNVEELGEKINECQSLFNVMLQAAVV
jgi:hypothetical protein